MIPFDLMLETHAYIMCMEVSIRWIKFSHSTYGSKDSRKIAFDRWNFYSIWELKWCIFTQSYDLLYNVTFYFVWRSYFQKNFFLCQIKPLFDFFRSNKFEIHQNYFIQLISVLFCFSSNKQRKICNEKSKWTFVVKENHFLYKKDLVVYVLRLILKQGSHHGVTECTIAFLDLGFMLKPKNQNKNKTKL